MTAHMILTEGIVLCILFTSAVLASAKNPLDSVYDLPEPIVNRCLELGLINETKTITSKETKLKKLAAAVLIMVVLALCLRYVNHVKTFMHGFLVSYLVWLIVDWYDCFILDWILVCNTTLFMIPGTEDLTSSWKDYKFHFAGSCKGMLIGLPVCLMAGAMVKLLALIAG